MLQYKLSYTIIEDFVPIGNPYPQTHVSFYNSSWGTINIWQRASLLFSEKLLKHAAVIHSAALINDVCRVVADQ